MYTVLHAIFGYFYLLLTVRVLSRRPGAQMTPFEFVIIFLMGGVIILTTSVTIIPRPTLCARSLRSASYTD